MFPVVCNVNICINYNYNLLHLLIYFLRGNCQVGNRYVPKNVKMRAFYEECKSLISQAVHRI